ncbi:Tetraacyldisaccharide 4'-kinase [Caulifigura coniformis]|uniref:Tetraacyldisaccharide 4'-kinase n=1 Tax=Caulifigura coniformis TaxID=2527983 RepID=A0A517SC60_9PLAN|nr:tetraacyldisaccharide 4'-kinase [Caulifigura coniformis]QDT53676.1 Tetraacyldisaccharide 4'-kinase [Caulifigura coniformis]
MPSEKAFLDIISGRRPDWPAAAARGALALLEPVYAAGAALKNLSFDVGIKRPQDVGVPVVSVGNLTTGGTGKTPVVAAVVQKLLQRGMKPAIASRGYRSVDAAGNDEKRVLDLLCPGVPHIQNRDRIAAARELVAHGAEIIVLDDGFQHRRLKRDLDIVLIDATNPWGYGRQLPRGLLRESRHALKRARLILVTRTDLVSSSERERLLDEIARDSSAPVVTSRFVPHGLRDRSGLIHSSDDLKGRQVVAFCGIGNPTGFRATLERAGLLLHSHAVTAFADHHHYTRDDLEALIAEAQASDAAAAVCTLKDLVKLPPIDAPIPILALEITLEIIDGSTAWERAIAGYGIPRAP